MNKITIEVESDIQEAFDQASEAEKQELKSLITIFFRKSLASKNLVQVMEEISTKAETRELIPEKLVVNSNDIDLASQGINTEQAKLLRESLDSFSDDWDSDEMSIYDNYDAAKANL